MFLREVIMATTMVHVRVDEQTKQRAAKALAGMGIAVSDAVRMAAGPSGRGEGPSIRCEGTQRYHREGDARRRRGQGKVSDIGGCAVQRPGDLIRCFLLLGRIAAGTQVPGGV